MEGFVHLLLGDKDGALKVLKDYLAANPARRAGLAEDSGWWYRSLQDDPEFLALVTAQGKDPGLDTRGNCCTLVRILTLNSLRTIDCKLICLRLPRQILRGGLIGRWPNTEKSEHMRRLSIPLLSAAVVLSACSDRRETPTEPNASLAAAKKDATGSCISPFPLGSHASGRQGSAARVGTMFAGSPNLSAANSKLQSIASQCAKGKVGNARQEACHFRRLDDQEVRTGRVAERRGTSSYRS